MTLDKAAVQQDLRTNVAEVIFKKEDGTVRKMRATLSSTYLPMREEYVPSQESEPEARDNPNVVAVWDIDAGGWRSFRLDRVISMQRLENF